VTTGSEKRMSVQDKQITISLTIEQWQELDGWLDDEGHGAEKHDTHISKNCIWCEILTAIRRQMQVKMLELLERQL